ncbi:hypothetical protein Tco_0593199 [Tanacetum coccineum]
MSKARATSRFPDYFKDKMLLMQAQENGAVLDEEQSLFLAGEQVTNADDDVDDSTENDLALNVDHIFEADECDAFDSDVNEGPTSQVSLTSEDLIYDEARPSYDSNDPFEIHGKRYVDETLEDQVSYVNDRSCVPYNALDVTALVEQNDCYKVELEKGQTILLKEHHIGYQWRPTGKKLTLGKLNCGSQWRPTGKKFALGEMCHLPKLSVKCRTGHALVSGLRLLSKTYDGESFKAHEFCGKVHRVSQIGDDHLGIYGLWMIMLGGQCDLRRVYYVEGLDTSILCSRGHQFVTDHRSITDEVFSICLLSKLQSVGIFHQKSVSEKLLRQIGVVEKTMAIESQQENIVRLMEKIIVTFDELHLSMLIVVPKYFQNGRIEDCWLQAMKKMISHEFDRLDVWELFSLCQSLTEGFEAKEHPTLVYRLKKALYGLKQSTQGVMRIMRVSRFRRSTSGLLSMSWMLALKSFGSSSSKTLGFDFNIIPLYCDNKVLLLMCWQQRPALSLKHIDIRQHRLTRAQWKIEWLELCSWKLIINLPDILTKGLTRERFEFLLPRLGMKSLTPETLKRLQEAFTASANVPAICLQQFWKTMSYNEKTGVYSCQVDEQWFDLSADLLRKALAITPVNQAHPFELPPSGDTVIDFVNELGYPEPVEIV